MTRRRKSKRAGGAGLRRSAPWWGVAKFFRSIDLDLRRKLIHGCGVSLLVMAVFCAGTITLSRLEAHVNRELVGSHAWGVEFVDLPEELTALASDDLRQSVSDLSTRRWTDERLCRDLTERLRAVGWVEYVNHVRRTGDGRVQASCRYRLASAMVQHGERFMLVDAEGVRLPGEYLYDPRWKLVQGVQAPPPEPGFIWEGGDVQAGLTIIEALAEELFAEQITAVLVDNFDGRVHRARSHVELATDRAGGRIRWGSAPGTELEENSVPQKLAILRENHLATGRIDAGYPVIDIATFPDRFTVPG